MGVGCGIGLGRAEGVADGIGVAASGAGFPVSEAEGAGGDAVPGGAVGDASAGELGVGSETALGSDSSEHAPTTTSHAESSNKAMARRRLAPANHTNTPSVDTEWTS